MIDINTAEIDDLLKVKGIGRVTAENILEYRRNQREKGGFSSLEELKNVAGIGSKKLQELKPQLTVEGVIKIKKITVEFNPAEYDLEQPEEVHLVGSMNNWKPADKSYPLQKGKDGVWRNPFKFKKGTEYKIMYDSSSWEEENHVGYYGKNFVME